MAENGPFGTPFLTPKLPRKSLCLCASFARSFPGNEAHKLFSGGPKWGVLGGGQKVYVEKVYVLFLSPSHVTTHASEKGSQKVLENASEKDSQKGSQTQRRLAVGFAVKKSS